jgi:hypothetical protein
VVGRWCASSSLSFGHDGVYIQCRRNAGAWALLAVDMVTQYIGNQPLLVANTPETRGYRMSFWDSGEANGDWTPVVKVMVGR